MHYIYIYLTAHVQVFQSENNNKRHRLSKAFWPIVRQSISFVSHFATNSINGEIYDIINWSKKFPIIFIALKVIDWTVFICIIISIILH